MSNINIRIEGLALCVQNDANGMWRVFFPKVADHDFKIIIEKKSISTNDKTVFEYPMPTATWIDLTPNAITTLSTVNVIDKKTPSIAKLHGEKITLTADKSKYAGFLNLHNCNLESRPDPQTPQQIDIWDSREQLNPTPANPSTKVWVARTDVHTNFLSRFSTEAGSSIEILMQNNFALDMKANLSVGHDADANFTVIFSNDCDGMHCEQVSDFKYFYNIIDENALNPKRRFEIVAVKTEGGMSRTGGPCGGSADPDGSVDIPFNPNYPG